MKDKYEYPETDEQVAANRWQEIEERDYYSLLGCVPPARRARGAFAVGEPMNRMEDGRSIHRCAVALGAEGFPTTRYYAKPYPIENFDPDLFRKQIEQQLAEDAELEKRFDADCKEHGSKHIAVDMSLNTAIILAAQLQLALRHPRNTGPSAVVTKDVCEKLIQVIAFTPAIREGLERGFCPSYDVLRKQLDDVLKMQEANSVKERQRMDLVAVRWDGGIGLVSLKTGQVLLTVFESTFNTELPTLEISEKDFAEVLGYSAEQSEDLLWEHVPELLRHPAFNLGARIKP